MKIGIDARTLNDYKKAGVDTYIKNLIEGFSKIDRKNQYILYINKPLKDRRIFKNKNFKERIINKSFLWTIVWLGLDLLMDKNRPDIFIFMTHSMPIIAPVKKIVVIYDLAYLVYPDCFTLFDRVRLSILTKIAAKRADYITTISRSSKNDIIKYYKIKPSKVSVIYLGYEKNVFKPYSERLIRQVRKKYHLHDQYITYIGTLQKRKNIARLIEAFAGFKKSTGFKHKLVIIGKKGWLYNDIFQKVKDLKMTREVRFLGYVDQRDMSILLSGSEIFALPSLYEGFGLPVIEAMASAVPVITSNTSSLKEVGENAALLINPKSVKSIQDALVKLSKNKNVRQKLIRLGLKRVNDFSWQKTAEDTIKVFKKV